MQPTTSKTVPSARYEAPRLQTYGKLQDLTKGSGGSLIDGDGTMTKI